MRFSSTVLTGVAVLACGAAAALSAAEFGEKLTLLERSLASEGPSMSVLDGFDTLIKDSADQDSSVLAKVYFKKALVELSLGKEMNSINNLQKSLELNNHNEFVKRKLLELCVKNGLQDKVNSLVKSSIISSKDPDYLETISTFEKIKELSSSQSIEDLNSAIELSPLNSELILKRIEFMKSNLNKDNQYQSFIEIINDFSILIKINPVLYSNYLNEVSEIYLFGLVEFNNSLNFNKKCLHFDMDNSDCKKNSKFLNKYNEILTLLNEFNSVYQFWGDENENKEDDEILEVDELKLNKLIAKLKDEKNFLKIRRENESFKTNYEYLSSRSKHFNDKYHLKFNTFDLTVLKSLIMDSFLDKNYKKLSKYSKQLSELSRTEKEKFLPLVLASVDKNLKHRKFHEAKQLLEKLTKNSRKNKYFKERASVIEKFEREQQWQQQQQRQQQQRQYYQQQQQQQQRRTPSKPKTDYYKILDVDRDADERTIRKAYREKTKQFHPDKYKGDLSQEEIEHKMTQINHAYEVLSDPELRQNYDLGDDPNDPESGQQQHHQQQQYQFHQGNPFAQHFGNGFGNFHFQF